MTYAEMRYHIDRKEWVDQYGKIYKIKDMSMQHIANCIKMIKSKGWRMPWLQVLQEEYDSRYIPPQ